MRSKLNSLAARGTKGNRRNSSRGSQLLEFALAVPILTLLVIGIWDFGANFELKQNLTNAARQAGRITVSTPFRNVTSGAPCQVNIPCAIVSAATATKQYLTNNGLDASWIDPSAPSSEPSGVCLPGASTWTWTSSTGTGANTQTYELDINAAAGIRQDGTVDAAYSTPTDTMMATQVTLKWPINWNNAAPFPSATYGTEISTTITMANIGGGCGSWE